MCNTLTVDGSESLQSLALAVSLVKLSEDLVS